MILNSKVTEETFYAESHEELDRHVKVRCDHESGRYTISGLMGEDKVSVDEEDLNGSSSVAAYQNALEDREESDGEVWENEELDSLI